MYTAFGRLHTGELLHGCPAAIGTELRLASNPVGTLFRDSALGQLVPKAQFKIGSEEAVFFG